MQLPNTREVKKSQAHLFRKKVKTWNVWQFNQQKILAVLRKNGSVTRAPFASTSTKPKFFPLIVFMLTLWCLAIAFTSIAIVILWTF